jgi:predicted permease
MNPRWRRYLGFFGRNVEGDVDDELRFHLEMRARDYKASGLASGDAWRAATDRFGNYTAVNTALVNHDLAVAKRQDRRAFMDDLAQDVRYALRSLRRAPGFALVAIATLALGIGANTAMFSIVDAVVVRALPFPRADKLVSVSAVVLAEATRIRELSHSYSDVAAYRAISSGISGDAEAERVEATAVSANLFSTLGVAMASGRAFSADENSPGKSNVVVLSDGLWRRRFAANRGVIGQSLMIEGSPYTIVGIAPSGFSFPSSSTQLWVPITMPPSRSGAFWGDGGYKAIARLRDGVTPAAAQQEIRTLYKQIRHENPLWDPGPTYGAEATVTPLQDKLVGSARTVLWLLFGVVGVVLLIACANVANLLLVRATARQREVAVRMALGGGRSRIIRQLLTESVVLALIGGLAGIAVAALGIRALVGILPTDVPRVATIGLDLRVLAFTMLLVLATGIVFGLIPAIRSSGTDMQRAMRNGARGSSGTNRRLANVLVCGEIGAAAVLLIAALLLVRSMWTLQNIDPGFRTTSIVTARVSPPAKRFTGANTSAVIPFADEMLRRVRGIPGVAAVSLASDVPFSNGIRSLAIRVEGQFENIRAGLPMVEHYQTVAPNYFTTIGIPLVAGRPLSDDDRAGTPDVALVSESFARHYWPNGDAVGKRIGYPWESPWVTIVGVVHDAKVDSLTSTSTEVLYRPFKQSPVTAMSLVIRTDGDIGALANALRSTMTGLDRSTPVSEIQTMRTMVDRSAARQRFTMLLLSLFAGVALVLGIIGIYGVMSYAVVQRTREIGVRMALGASPSDARRMVLREALIIAIAGIGGGLVAAALSTRALGNLLYGVSATDPITFASVPLAITIVALIASYLPARRATRVDPTSALRAD